MTDLDARAKAGWREAARLWRVELAVVAIALLAALVIPASSSGAGAVPPGIIALGLVTGAGLALNALGVVLVYRAHGFINFGQIALGAVGAGIFSAFVQYRPLFRWIDGVCPPCVAEQSRGFNVANYAIAATVGIGLSLAVSWLIYVVVIKRLAQAPPMVLMVASIFVAPVAAALAGPTGLLLQVLTTKEQREGGLQQLGAAPLPFDFTLTISPAQLHAADILVLLAATAAGVFLLSFMRLTATGRAMRAAADNSARAETMGVEVTRINSIVWLLAGALSAMAAFLGSMGAVSGRVDGLGTSFLVRLMLIAVVARFSSIPMALVASATLGIVSQAVQWASDGASGVIDASMVVVVAGLLLLRSRERAGRADEDVQHWAGADEVRPVSPRIAALPSVVRAKRVTLIAASVALLGVPWITSPSQTNLLSLGAILAMVAVSVLILTAWAGQVSLGQFAFAAVGAFCVAKLNLPFVAELVVATIAGAVVAALVGIPALKLRGLYLAVSTLALAVSTTTLLVGPNYFGKSLPPTINRPKVLNIDFADERAFCYLTFILLAALIVAARGLRSSHTGRVLLGTRDNEHMAQAYGLSVTRARVTAFVLSGGIAAFAGGVYAVHQGGVRMASFDEAQSINIFSLAVIGGLGSLLGPVLAGVYQSLLTIFGTSPALFLFAVGIGGLGLVLFAPGGLVGLAAKSRDAIFRYIAERQRLDLRSDSEELEVPSFAPGAEHSPRRYRLERQWAVARERDAADTDPVASVARR